MLTGLKGLTGMETGLAAVIIAIGAVITTIITATRKRRDVDIDELLIRVETLTNRIDHLEAVLDEVRTELVVAEHNVFVLRRTLSNNGLADPTTMVS